MNGGVDFTNCRRVIGKAYNGANGKKGQKSEYTLSKNA